MASRVLSLREWEREKPFVTDSVEVQNLECVILAGVDIWGRPKPQPARVTVRLGLSQPFATAAATDSVDASTVHYGLLSKSILSHLSKYSDIVPDSALDGICHTLAYKCIETAGGPSAVASVEVSCTLPKGTRYGEGMSLSIAQCPVKDLNSVVMGLHRLAIPCIIGVNQHERLMKQTVIASVWIDKCRPQTSIAYPELEQLVAKTIEESSFETLEALAEEVAGRVVKYFIFTRPSAMFLQVAGVRVRLEKPSAVPLAEAPAIEIYRSAGKDDPFGKRMIAELGNKTPVVPFPLTGRLDEFLQSQKQD